jgi:hypothetical protein
MLVPTTCFDFLLHNLIPSAPLLEVELCRCRGVALRVLPALKTGLRRRFPVIIFFPIDLQLTGGALRAG